MTRMSQLQIVRAALMVNDRLSPFEQRIVAEHVKRVPTGETLTCDCRSCATFNAIYKEAMADAHRRDG